MTEFSDKVALIWSIAELIRGPYKPPQYGDVILPLTVLRRLDCVLEATKAAVLAKAHELKGKDATAADRLLKRAAKLDFYNTSKLDFQKIKGDPDNVAKNLVSYMKGFSPNAREIIDYFGFEKHIEKLAQHERLYLVVKKFAETDLHPDVVPAFQMGLVFEELIRKFKELSNEEAGDHFTPREVIRLMVNLLLTPDTDVLRKKGIIKTVYDPACGTGGMLSVADEYVLELNPDAQMILFGQEYNDESFAICGSDMLIKGQSLDNLKFGDTFLKDGLKGQTFDYMLANPPFGVEWKPEQSAITKEHEELGFSGRFGAGVPRISDGSLLFLQHMLSKMKSPEEGGSRIAVVFNGSPLFTGDAGSGESEIRRWIIEHDWLETIVALPDQLFYNTGIATYVWIVTNRKTSRRRKKIQLINATSFFQRKRKNSGMKRNEISPSQIAEITRIYGAFVSGPYSKIFDRDDFGYRQITIERPLRLRFEVTEGRLSALMTSEALEKALGLARMRASDANDVKLLVESALRTLIATGTILSREAFFEAVRSAFVSSHTKLSSSLRKALVQAFAERDREAEICRQDDGTPEADVALRDSDNVPLKETVGSYFDREVLPHMPDAWIDHGKTKLGFEIPFNRQFYIYTPPRALRDIEAEIQVLEAEIVRSLTSISR
ncbi:MAG: type restriction enzyme protein [Thermoanaerobaculia bacterium]|nr:type restriction enzyme protein [Thermoanaerobaculia bacterium]